MRHHPCPACKQPMAGAIYLGLPMRVCVSPLCEAPAPITTGIGAWVAMLWYNGKIMIYENCGYLSALWSYVRGSYEK